MRFLLGFLLSIPVLWSQDDVEGVLKNLSRTTAKRLEQRMTEDRGTLRIGVFNFERQQFGQEWNLNFSAFENYMNDQTVGFLLKYRGRIQLEVVERNSLEKVIREQDFSVSDYVNQNQSVAIGQLLNADVIMIGSYQLIKDYLSATIKVLEVSTGTIVLLESYDIAIDKRVDDLLGYTAYKKKQKAEMEMLAEQKRREAEDEARQRKRDEEYRKNLAHGNERFFSGGVSGYFSWHSKEPKFRNWAATVDFGVFYRRLVAKAGYAKYSRVIDGQYLLFGGETKFAWFRFGYMRGLSLKKDETIDSNIKTNNAANHFYLNLLDGETLGITINYSRLLGYSLWGMGLSVH